MIYSYTNRALVRPEAYLLTIDLVFTNGLVVYVEIIEHKLVNRLIDKI